MRIRKVTRAFGFDVSRQMGGGAAIPFRVRRVRPVGPLATGRRSIPEQFEVRVEDCTSFLAFPFGSRAFNPLVATLRQRQANSELSYQDSVLFHFHQRFHPATLQELFFGSTVQASLWPLSELPPVRSLYRFVWATTTAEVREALGQGVVGSDNYFFGPHPIAEGEQAFARLVNVFDSIRREGYRPEQYGRISGYFIGNEQRFRFVVAAGTHRMAALAALGVETVGVRLHSHPAVIHESQLDDWTPDRGGPFDPQTAAALFELFAAGDGFERSQGLCDTERA